MKRGELGVNLLFGFEKRSEKRFGGFGDVLFAHTEMLVRWNRTDLAAGSAKPLFRLWPFDR